MIDRDKVYNIDPGMLVSMINMKLRNEFPSIERLTAFYDLELDNLLEHLHRVGFCYLSSVNQFR